MPALLLHVSRGVRWDSDHVVSLDDPTKAIMEELVRGDFLSRTSIGLDFFDASINRIAAWVMGTRNAIKALLLALLLEPISKLRELETAGDYTQRLALLEEIKTLPFGAVWDEYCRRQNVPTGANWIRGSQVLRKLCSFQAVVTAYETQGLRDVGEQPGWRKNMNGDIPQFGLSWKPSLSAMEC